MALSHQKGTFVSNQSLCGANNVVEHYRKIIEILHWHPFEGWPTRARPTHPFWQLLLGRPCPVMSAVEWTPLQGFNSFSILLHYYNHISKNWRPILPCSYFWTFAQCDVGTGTMYLISRPESKQNSSNAKSLFSCPVMSSHSLVYIQYKAKSA